eukprot:XP_001693663.1 predicted protein [Chlamydomonas reinhardtii]
MTEQASQEQEALLEDAIALLDSLLVEIGATGGEGEPEQQHHRSNATAAHGDPQGDTALALPPAAASAGVAGDRQFVNAAPAACSAVRAGSGYLLHQPYGGAALSSSPSAAPAHVGLSALSSPAHCSQPQAHNPHQPHQLKVLSQLQQGDGHSTAAALQQGVSQQPHTPPHLAAPTRREPLSHALTEPAPGAAPDHHHHHNEQHHNLNHSNSSAAALTSGTGTGGGGAGVPAGGGAAVPSSAAPATAAPFAPTSITASTIANRGPRWHGALRAGNKSRVEKARLATQDPFWDEFFVFDVAQPAFAVLKIKVYDHRHCWRPAFVGQVRIPVHSIAEFPARFAPPSWHTLRSRAGRGIRGQVQMQLFYTAEWVHRPLRVFAGTWNVGNAQPAADLSPWLQGVSSLQHDLVAIGVQDSNLDCSAYAAASAATTPRSPAPSWAPAWAADASFTTAVKSRGGGVLSDVTAKVGVVGGGEFREVWEERIKEAVGPGYFKVAGVHMGQIRLLLFARNDIYAAVSDGGVGVSLRVWDTTLAFINSHLAAHQDKTRARNAHYRDIVRGLKPLASDPGGVMDALTAPHHVVWMGDLNYRLDWGAQAHTPTESPAPGDFADLVREADQLRKEVGAKRAFLGFTEGPIAFEPSFKVRRRRGHDYNPQRSPAYCDRVLYRSNLPLKQIRCVSYFSPADVASSDHKPVAAELLLLLTAPCIYAGATDAAAWAPFQVQLELHGLPAGTLEGHMRIEPHQQAAAATGGLRGPAGPSRLGPAPSGQPLQQRGAGASARTPPGRDSHGNSNAVSAGLFARLRASLRLLQG